MINDRIITNQGIRLLLLKVTRVTDFDKYRRAQSQHNVARVAAYSYANTAVSPSSYSHWGPINTRNDGEVIEIIADASANNPQDFHKWMCSDYFEYEGRDYIIVNMNFGRMNYASALSMSSQTILDERNILKIDAHQILGERFADVPNYHTMMDRWTDKPKKKKKTAPKLYKEQGSWAMPL